MPTRRHVHTVVRTLNGGDYGMDLLRCHHLAHDHGAGRLLGQGITYDTVTLIGFSAGGRSLQVPSHDNRDPSTTTSSADQRRFDRMRLINLKL